MVDMASLAVRMDTSDLRRGKRDLGDVSTAAVGAERSADGAGRAFGSMSAAMVAAAVAAAALGAALAAGKLLGQFIDATVTAEASQAQLGAAILSTGGAAGRSIEQLNAHAASLQRITNFGDEATNAMQGVLLTFTQVRGDQFDAATVAVMDLATAMGTDLSTAALQVGRALNDPVLGMTALSRSGIQFTEAQKEMVRQLVASNDVIGAQTVILAELETQFGGSAEAARNTLGGALASLRNAFGDLFELSGPGSENLRASIERLTATVANPAFFAAVQSIGTALFAAAEMGVNALAMLLPVITAVVENIDVIAYSAGIAAAVFAGPYVVAMGAAAIASFSMTGALAILKTALITTGIGALIVGAGYLVAMFGRLVTATGGFGNAITLLGNVAREVVERMSANFSGMGNLVSSVAKMIQSSFLMAFEWILRKFVDVTQTVADGVNNLFAGIGIDFQVTGMGAGAADAISSLVTETQAASIAAAGLASTQFQAARAPLASIQALRDAMTESATATEGAAAEALALNTQLETLGGDGTTGSGGGTAGNAAAAIEEATTFAGGFAEAMADGTKSAVEMGRELGGALLNGIGSVSDAFGDFVARGFSDFKGFVSSILDSFKSMLAQMISMAVKNSIILGLDFVAGGTASAGTAAGGGGTGIAGSIASSVISGILGSGTAAAAGSGLVAGVAGVFGIGGGAAAAAAASTAAATAATAAAATAAAATGTAAAASTAAAAATAATAASTAAVAGTAAAIGAAALPLLAVAAVVGVVVLGLRKKTKELDAGIVATVKGMDTLVQTFSVVKTTRFFGLSKKVRTSMAAAGAETTNAITGMVDTLQGGVLASAAALGIAGSTFENFAYTMRISTKGLSEEAANKAVQDAVMGMADSMARMVSGLSAFAIGSEGSAATLDRLAQSLVAVNSRMGYLGLNTHAVSLAGAGAAAAFAGLFGSLENFNAVSQSYYQNFYTDAERVARATELLSLEMLALGIDALPATLAAFRALVDEADALGDSGLVASLMQLSPAFAEISAGANALGDSLRALVNEDLFATGQDYIRALSRAGNNQAFTPRESDAQLRAELRALNVSMERLISSAEITAGNTARGADAADDTLAFQLEQTL